MIVQINNVGYNFIHSSNFEVNRPHGSEDYVIIILRTKAEFIFGEEKVLASAGSFILYNKGRPQHFRASEETFANDWVHFDMSVEEARELRELQIPFDVLVPLDGIKDISQIIKTMYQEKYSVNYYREQSLLLYFKLLFIKISEKIIHAEHSNISPYYEKLSALRTEIYNHPEKTRSVKNLSKELVLSESYFQHLYKRLFGVSVVSDIITARVEHGKYLLSGSDISVREVSQECGYKNDVQFMRQFKTLTGMTPSEYRKQFRVSSDEIARGSTKQPFNLV